MATPLYEEIKNCEQDIARFEADLEEIIKEADEDGVRDEEETKEIESFETSIKDLKAYLDKRKAEFESNKAEWNGLSSDVSEMLADFQTLTDWGSPGLDVIDRQITEMDTNASSHFYRDAINSYQAAQENITPLMEEYNTQSAAKLDYDEAMDDAWKRVEACRASDTLSQDITARLDQVETDFQSCGIMAENLDYAGALSSLQPTIDEISNVEGMIEEVGKEIDRIQRRYSELLGKRSEALGKMQNRREMMDELLDQCMQAEATFNALMNDHYFEQAEQLLERTEATIATATERFEAIEAAEQAEAEKQAAEEKLLAAERDKLAQELSASPAKGTAWILHEWNENDSFEKLAGMHELATVELLLGHPNNQRLSDHFRANGDLPVGTLVCILSPNVELYTVELNNEKFVLTGEELRIATSSNTQLMNDAAANYRALYTLLAENHKIALDAREMFGIVTEFMTGLWNDPPDNQRDTAGTAVTGLESAASSGNGDQFGELVVGTANACEAYQVALIDWIGDMQTSLSKFMYCLSWAETFAKTTAGVLFITATAPGSVPALVLYSAGSGAGISLLSDVSGNLAAWKLGMETLTWKEIRDNALYHGAIAGFTAGVAGTVAPCVAKPFIKHLGTATIPGCNFYNQILEVITLAWPSTTRPATAISIQIVEVCRATFIYRMSVGTLKALLLPHIEKWFTDNPEQLTAPTAEAAANKAADELVTEEIKIAFFDALYDEFKDDIDNLVRQEVAKHAPPEEQPAP